MNAKDILNNLKTSRAIEPRVIMAGNATYTSSTIDRQGFEALMFAIAAGTLTDATYTCDVYAGNASNMSDEVVCTSAELVGQAAAFTFVGTAGADSNVVKKVAYNGDKRYVRLKIVQSGATTGGYITATAVQGGARNNPA